MGGLVAALIAGCVGCGNGNLLLGPTASRDGGALRDSWPEDARPRGDGSLIADKARPADQLLGADGASLDGGFDSTDTSNDTASQLPDASGQFDGPPPDTPSPPDTPPPVLPNIVFILLDDAAYGDFGIAGTSAIQTPSIDRVATQGLQFSRFYTNAPRCSPTRASLISGNFPLAFGINRPLNRVNGTSSTQMSHRGLPGYVRTLAEVLRTKGYRTGHVGKWNLGLHRPQFRPINQGFESAVTYEGDHVSASYWNPTIEIDDRSRRVENGHLTEILTRYAKQFISDHRNERFFLNLWHFAPHWPFEPPKAWANRYPNTEEGRYRALLSHADEQIGELLDHLDALGLADNTLVVITSDNGGSHTVHQSHNGGLRGFKGDLYEGGIRTPLIARWPGKVASRTQSQARVTSMDLLPTIVELVGDNPTTLGVPGESFATVLRGSRTWQRKQRLYWQDKPSVTKVVETSDARLYWFAMLDGPWKLLLFGPADQVPIYRLFDIAKDPRETTNLAAAHQQRVKAMVAQYQSWRMSTSHIAHSVDHTEGSVTSNSGKLIFNGAGQARLANNALYDFHDGDFSCTFTMTPKTVGTRQRVIGKPGSWELTLQQNGALNLRAWASSSSHVDLASSARLVAETPYRVTVSFYGVKHGPVLIRLYVNGGKQAENRSLSLIASNNERIYLGSKTNALFGTIANLALRATALTVADMP